MQVKLVQKARFSTKIHLMAQKDPERPVDFQGKAGEVAVRYDRDQTFVYGGLGEKIPVPVDVIRTTTAKTA